MLGCACLFDKAHAAMNLNAEAGDFCSDVCAPCLDQRGEDFAHIGRGFIAQSAAIHLTGCVIKQGARAFCQRLHPYQHAAHIGMLDDCHRGRIARPCTGRLHSVIGVDKRLLERSFANLHALIANIDPSVVHHGEHGHQPAIFRADQLANAIVIIAIAHNASRRGIDAQLML